MWEFLWYTEGILHKTFVTVRQKNTAKLVTPPPLLFINFVETRVFLIHKCFDYKVLRYCETTIFRRKTVILPLSQPLIQNIFRLSETQKGFSTKCFVTVRQNSFDKKSWYSPTFYHKFIWYQKFSETRKGSRTKFFGNPRQKFFDRKMWYSPTPLVHKKFRYQDYCEIQKGSPTKFFGTLSQKFSNGK